MAQPLTFTPLEEDQGPGLTFTPIDVGSEPIPGAPETMGQKANRWLGSLHQTIGNVLTGLDRPPIPERPPEGTMVPSQNPLVKIGLMKPYMVPGGGPVTQSRGFIAPSDVNQVPQNLTQAGVQAGTTLGLLSGSPAARVLGAVFGGAAGMGAEGRNPVSAEGVREIGLPIATSEILSAAIPSVARKLPWSKGVINEMQAEDRLKALEEIDPELRQTVQGQEVSPELKGPPGQTFPRLRKAAMGGDIQKTASASIERDIQAVDRLAGNPTYNTPAIKQAYDRLPDLEKTEVIGPPGPNGFTLHQAQQIREYLNSQAFAQSPLGQGVRPVAKQKLVGRVTAEIEAPFTPEAQALWDQANRRYGATMVAAEDLQQPGIVQGLPNRLLMNRNATSAYLDRHRQEITRRLGGPEAYNAYVDRVLAGAEPGTRDILASGAGTPGEAYREILGRGKGGSPQLLGGPLRTLFPELGSERTGREPFTPPQELKALATILLQRGIPEAMRNFANRYLGAP